MRQPVAVVKSRALVDSADRKEPDRAVRRRAGALPHNRFHQAGCERKVPRFLGNVSRSSNYAAIAAQLTKAAK